MCLLSVASTLGCCTLGVCGGKLVEEYGLDGIWTDAFCFWDWSRDALNGLLTSLHFFVVVLSVRISGK